MTREDAIYCMTSYLPDNEVEHCTSCKYYDACKSDEAHKMAIRSLEARKNVHGKWFHEQLIPNDITGHMHGECSICHAVRIIDNFCPNCGADMRERIEDAEVC